MRETNGRKQTELKLVEDAYFDEHITIVVKGLGNQLKAAMVNQMLTEEQERRDHIHAHFLYLKIRKF